MKCPKCKAISGDDWTQCNGQCPMQGSPHFDPSLRIVTLATVRDAGEENHIECRFYNGEKYAAIRTDNDETGDILAFHIVKLLKRYPCAGVKKLPRRVSLPIIPF